MIIENEDVVFDYFEGILTIKMTQGNEYFHSDNIKRIEKFSFDFDGDTYNYIAIETHHHRKGTETTFLTDISIDTDECNKILCAISKKNDEIMTYLTRTQYGFEHDFWKELFVLAYNKFDFNPYNFKKEVTGDVINACFYGTSAKYIQNFVKNDFQDLYYSIVNHFLPDKIEETQKSLIIKEISNKKNNLTDIYGAEFKNKETIFIQFTKEIKTELDKQPSHQIKEWVGYRKNQISSEKDYWINIINDDIIDSIWCEQYIKILGEKEKLIDDLYAEYLYNNDEAVIRFNQHKSTLGDDFENEEFVVYQYIKAVTLKLQSLDLTFDTISDFIKDETEILWNELNFWKLQLSENKYVESNWIEKYILVLNNKQRELRKLYNEFINSNSETLLFSIASNNTNNLHEEVRYSSLKSQTNDDCISEIIRIYTEDSLEYLRKYGYYNNVIAVAFNDNYSGDEYNKLLTCKIDMLKSMYVESIENFCGKISDKKIEFLEKLKSMDFMYGLELYKEFVRISEVFKTAIYNKNCSFYKDTNSLYFDFYFYGSILVSNQLNKINKNPSPKRYIPEAEINKSMMYFYDAQTIEEAEEKHRERDYIENQKNGLSGENEVNYALKWLDQSYVKIDKKSVSKPISLYNPDFIDEPQEYDHIVIGKQGVFNIETKNYAGKLIVDINGNWIRVKNDGTQEGERNPIQQLRRHEKLLRSIIGPEIPIINIICMAHPKMIIEGVENCSVPLIKSDLLVEYIENYKSESSISDEEIRSCVTKIENHMR